ncbi:M56 family metallopeptidase [Rhodoflexus sp.]
MTPFEHLVQNRALMDAFGWAIIHSLWQTSLIALLCGISLVILCKKSAHLRYGVALSFMAAAFIAFFGTFIWLYEPANAAAGWSSAAEQAFTINYSRLTNQAVMTWADCRTPTDYYFFIMQWLGTQLPVVVAVWCIGAAIFAVRLGLGLLQTQRLRTVGISPVADEWADAVREMAKRMHLKKPVQFYESAMIHVPMVIGWLKPVILFPVGLLAALPPQEIAGILAHELAHIRRNDFLVHIGQSLVEVLLFYHPAIWWLSAQINRERENCCDDLAIAATGNTLAYIKALANLADFTLKPATVPSYAMAATGQKGGLLQRIMRIAQPHRAESYALQYFSTRFAVALTLFCSLALFAFSTKATILAEEVRSTAKEIVHKAEIKLDRLLGTLEDTTKKERQKVTVVKKDGERRDTVVMEADEIMVDFGNRKVTVAGDSKLKIDSLFSYKIATIKLDSNMRRFYTRIDSNTFRLLPTFRFEFDNKSFNKIYRLSDSLSAAAPFIINELQMDQDRLLLEKMMEELDKISKLSQKQKQEVREAMQKARKEIQEARKKIDSLGRLHGRNIISMIEIEGIRQPLGAVGNSVIIRKDMTGQFIYSEDADYFIDGKPVSREEVQKLAPAKIKSVEVQKLKGAEKGVIRITTKGGN